MKKIVIGVCLIVTMLLSVSCGSNTANTAGASVNNGCYTCLQPSNVTLTSNTTNSCGCQS